MKPYKLTCGRARRVPLLALRGRVLARRAGHLPVHPDQGLHRARLGQPSRDEVARQRASRCARSKGLHCARFVYHRSRDEPPSHHRLRRHGGRPRAAEVVRGAAQLTLESPRHPRAAGGRPHAIDEALAEVRHNAERIAVHHTRRRGRHGREARAPRSTRSRSASVLLAARLVRDGEADALVSAGNTGAGVLACAQHLQPDPRRAAGGAGRRLPDGRSAAARRTTRSR